MVYMDRCFPIKYKKFSRTPFLQNRSGRLLLYAVTWRKDNRQNMRHPDLEGLYIHIEYLYDLQFWSVITPTILVYFHAGRNTGYVTETK